MIGFVLHALWTDPEIAVFLAIALGVFVGRMQFAMTIYRA
jgi:putative transport protein